MSVISLCGSSGANTGPMDCDVRRARVVEMIVGSASFDSDDYASSAVFKTAFLDRINKAAGTSDKLFPFPEVQNTTNNTEANVVGTTGTGFQFILREGKPGYTFGVIVGSNQEKQLRKFNGLKIPVFFFDSNGNVWGKLNAAGDFVGIKALIFVGGKPFSDGNSVDTEYTNVTVSIESAADFFDFAAFVNTDFNISDLEGLLDVELSLFNLASNVAKIKGVVKNSQLGADQNIADTYGTELASASLWEAGTGTNFATPLTLTSVAYSDTTNKVFSITYDTTLYAALASGTEIRTRMKSPATLKAADVIGIESIAVIVTKP